MTPEQRRAHLILQGLVLIDEWRAYCKVRSYYTGANTMQADRAFDEARMKWEVAVTGALGHCPVWRWHPDGCVLGDSQEYLYVMYIP